MTPSRWQKLVAGKAEFVYYFAHHMPAKSQRQANLMRAAEHGASFPMAQKIRASMTAPQMREFETVKPPTHHGANLGKYLHKPKGR